MAREVSALQKIKTSVSKSDAKLDSRLLVERANKADKAAAATTPKLQTGVAVSTSNTVLVDIRATRVSDDLLSGLAKSGVSVKSVSTGFATVRAEVPMSALSTVAARKDVRKVQVAAGAFTARETPIGAPAKPESKEQKQARIEQTVRNALNSKAALATIDGEGDRAHAADTARQQFGVTGVGVKICALSDGVDSLPASQALGELPASVDVLAGQEGSGDEGTAMLEIIHDLAPGAALGFATAFNGDASFADNIVALRTTAHCNIIVDDVLYFNESPFQDGMIAQAVNTVTADGALYFSSAGNEGNVIDGTSGHWEGNFVDSGRIVGKFAGTAHDFDPGAGVQVFEPISDNSSAGVPVALWWSDPLGHAADDYDLYLFDGAGHVVNFSQDVQDGTQDPTELLQTPAFGGAGLRLAVVKFSGANQYLSLSALRGRFSTENGLTAYVTPGVTLGHSAARAAFSVAAAPANVPLPFDLEPGDPANPRGPYPGSFTSSSKLERFTSDGPRKVFFQADGTPIAGGEVRQKPDITAADGVRTSVGGFDPFFGTSAAAPHAAAIAGLVLSGNPGLAPADVREALINTAVDLAPAGWDSRSGKGVLLADQVLGYTGASPQPLSVAQKPTVVGPNGSQYVNPGDTATITLPVTNIGDGLSASTSVVLTTTSTGVTITPRSKNYGTIDHGQTVINTFSMIVPAGYPVGVPVVLNAKVTFAGALSPTNATFQVPIGQPSTVVHDFAYAGAPVAIPDNSSVGVTVPITVSGIGRASKLTFSVDGTTCSTDAASTTVGIDHTYVGDLTGVLTSPSGATATVFQRNGGGGNNLCKVVFDDTAATSFSTVSSSQAPFTGTWKALSSLSALLTAPVDGTWTFKVTDSASVDTGSVRAVSLHINGFVTPGSP